MLILGFDFGTKYIGVAVGQKITRTATPVTSIIIDDGVDRWENVFKCIDEWSPSVIIIGSPFGDRFDNKVFLRQLNDFIDMIKIKFNIPVHIVNEHLSTWKAKKNYPCSKKKLKSYFLFVNAMSATILVEQWLLNIKC